MSRSSSLTLFEEELSRLCAEEPCRDVLDECVGGAFLRDVVSACSGPPTSAGCWERTSYDDWRCTPAVALDWLARNHPDADLLKGHEALDACILGVTTRPKDTWPRKPGVPVALYDADAVVEVFVSEGENVSYTDAWDFFFNTAEAWAGDGTPAFHYEGGEE